MNKGIVKVIIALTAVAAFSGCSSIATQQPILSAADATSSIRVSVRALEPADIEDTLIAAAD